MNCRAAVFASMTIAVVAGSGWCGYVEGYMNGWDKGGMEAAKAGGSLMPVRDKDGMCLAADQDQDGKVVGKWSPRNGRCELRDWRLAHPFG